jgi:hypothetical protein
MRFLKKIFGIDPAKRDDAPTGLRGSGVTGGQGIFDEYFNQILFELGGDHIVDTEANVKLSNPTGTIYFNSTATEFQDKNDVTAVINNGDKIIWRGLDAITADIDISTIDDLEHIMFYGNTISLGSQNMSIGSGQFGQLSITGSGNLNVDESAGLRVVKAGGLSVVNLSGDIVVDNTLAGISSANIDAKDLKIEYVSASTVTITADSLKLVSSDNQSVVVNNISATPDIATVGNRQNGAAELSDAIYDIWAGSTSGGSLEYKYLPRLSATTDGTTAFELVDSSEDFTTHLNAIGDKVFNDTTGDFAFVTAVTNAASGRLELDKDIFTSGDDYTIELRSPTFTAGYTFLANIGSVENVSGNFDAGSLIFINSIYYGNTISEKQVAKAWVNFDGTGTISINDSFGVTSLVDIGTGDYNVNLSEAMASVNFCTLGDGINIGVDNNISVATAPIDSSTIKVTCFTTTNSPKDTNPVNVVVFGDKQ